MKKINKNEDGKIVVYRNEISQIVKEANAIEIKNERDMKEASELLSRLNQFNDKIAEEREKVTKPLNEALKAERMRWKPIETPNAEAIAIVREKMSVYQTAEIKRQREEEARIAARVGEGKGKIKIETAVKKLDDVEKPDDQVKTDSGLTAFREDKVLRMIDASLIPREYLVVDEKKVLEALKAGIKVPGAEVEIKMVPINYR